MASVRTSGQGCIRGNFFKTLATYFVSCDPNGLPPWLCAVKTQFLKNIQFSSVARVIHFSGAPEKWIAVDWCSSSPCRFSRGSRKPFIAARTAAGRTAGQPGLLAPLSVAVHRSDRAVICTYYINNGN